MCAATRSAISKSEVLDRIGELPRVKLARLCTPFEEVTRFREALAERCEGGLESLPRIFIKRDDATGFAFGGNKARHMEFLFARFIERGIDTIVNINHYHSNQARFVAASCAKLGLKCHLVSVDMVDAPMVGNLLIGKLTGAEIHRVPSDYSRQVADNLVEDEVSQGRSATVLSDEKYADIAGIIGFLETGVEIESQLDEAGMGDVPVRMWGLVGRSIAGLRLYAKNVGLNWQASATAYSPTNAASYEATYLDRSERVTELLNLPTALESGDLDTLIDYVGDDYGVPHDGVLEAIHMMAASEGIILDPNYTGKSMSALIGEARAGRLDPDTPIVFIHSGGMPQTFAFADALWEWSAE